MILTNARILTFDAANRVLDSGSVEILADGTIGFVRSGRALDAHAVDLQRPPADAGPDQLPHASLQHAGPRHAPARPAARRLSGDPEEALVAAGSRAERRGRLLQRADRTDRFGQMRRGHGDRSPLQPQCLRRQPGFHRAGLPRSRTARRHLLRDQRSQRQARRAGGDSRECPLPRTGPARRAGGRHVRPARRLHAERPYAAPPAWRPTSRSARDSTSTWPRMAATARRSAACASAGVLDASARWPRTASTSRRRSGSRWRAAASTWSTIRNRTATTRSGSPTCRTCFAAACWWDWAPTATRRACGMSSRLHITCRKLRARRSARGRRGSLRRRVL